MTLNRLKVLSCTLAATVLSAVSAVNVTAAELGTNAMYVTSQNDYNIIKYASEFLGENVNNLDTLSPHQIDVVEDYYIYGNYVRNDISKQTEYNADGSVKQAYEFEYDPATGRQYKETYLSPGYSYYDIYEYDSKGIITRSNRYNMNGILTGYTIYQHDHNGYLSNSNSYSTSGELSNYVVYDREYWDNGELREICYHFYTKLDGEFVEFTRIHSRFNENGDEIYQVYYSYNYNERQFREVNRSEVVFTTDGNGCQVIERRNRYVGGVFNSYYTYVDRYIDDNTKETITYCWNPDDSLQKSWKDIYKKSGNNYYLTESIDYDANGNYASKQVYDRDEDRVLKQTNYDGNGNITSWTEYEYIRNEFYDNGHYVPNFDAYVAPENCVFQYRLYNPNSGEHFYTGSEEEVRNLAQVGWNFEGSGFIAPNAGNAIYRLYSEEHGDHFYTTDVTERDAFVTDGWTVEGIAFPSVDASVGRPMYRLYNPNAYNLNQSGAYHYTMSEQEKDNLITAGWNYQGIAWYSV